MSPAALAHPEPEPFAIVNGVDPKAAPAAMVIVVRLQITPSAIGVPLSGLDIRIFPGVRTAHVPAAVINKIAGL